MRAGAAAAGRPVPPLVGHIPVAISTDHTAVRDAARTQLALYGRAPFYQRMFADAGYPIGADGVLPDALLDELVVSGDASTVAARLAEIQSAGIDELLVLLVPTRDAEAEEAELMAILANA
jgi:alkanesulfonate monooxygenase SsuD/methylene tetrahydromethanopterin reductase-like flavin-dependent oxidoreductase (luciferase family)